MIVSRLLCITKTQSMTRTLFLLAFLWQTLNFYSQNFIKGSVTDSLKTPIAYCPIALMNASDSIQVKGNISDSSGYFIFENIKPGTYFIQFSAVGYAPEKTESFVFDSLSQINLPPTILKIQGVNLKEA